MHEDSSRQTVSIIVRGGVITGRVLKRAIDKALGEIKVRKSRGESWPDHGKTSVRKLMKSGAQLSNIEVTDSNIKSFERVARKYNVDYGLKKDKTREPPVYYVFFKAKDVDVIEAAFKEYVGRTTLKRDNRKVSVKKRLEQAKALVAKHRQREKSIDRDRGPSL